MRWSRARDRGPETGQSRRPDAARPDTLLTLIGTDEVRDEVRDEVQGGADKRGTRPRLRGNQLSNKIHLNMTNLASRNNWTDGHSAGAAYRADLVSP